MEAGYPQDYVEAVIRTGGDLSFICDEKSASMIKGEKFNTEIVHLENKKYVSNTSYFLRGRNNLMPKLFDVYVVNV